MSTPQPVARNQATSAYEIYTFYLDADSLQGRSHELSIARTEVQDIWDPKQKRKVPHIVLHFDRARRALALNKTQAEAMIEIAHDDKFQNWVGMHVILTPTDIEGGRKTITITAAPAQNQVQDPGQDLGHDLGQA